MPQIEVHQKPALVLQEMFTLIYPLDHHNRILLLPRRLLPAERTSPLLSGRPCLCQGGISLPTKKQKPTLRDRQELFT